MEILDLAKPYDWMRGHIDPWWELNHRSLDYVREPFNNPADVLLWRSQGYTHEHFTGELYDMSKPSQNWMNIDQLQQHFGFENLGWAYYKMSTGVILPRHVDTFKKFRQLFDTTNKTIVRALILLEDWQLGHYLDIDNVAITDWKAGDYVVWTETCPHSAANIGIGDRYTLQLTGFLS